jgi:two-component system, NarL family, response regulator NreC
MSLRLLLVDDLYVVRAGLRSLFADRPDWQICGEVEDGENAVIKAANLQPDVVILELALPKMNGPEAAMKIRSVSPSAKIIFFSSFPMSGTPGVFGADAFVSKAAATRELITTIERLAQSRIVSRSA